MSDKQPTGWRLLAEIDHSLLALAQALRAAEPERLAEALKGIEGAAEAIRKAQQAKTAEALWAAWKAFSDFRLRSGCLRAFAGSGFRSPIGRASGLMSGSM